MITVDCKHCSGLGRLVLTKELARELSHGYTISELRFAADQVEQNPDMITLIRVIRQEYPSKSLIEAKALAKIAIVLSS